VYQKRLNDWYETHQTAFGQKKGCIGKLDPCNDHKTCGKLPVKETVEASVTSTFLSADYLELKTNRMLNKLLQIKGVLVAGSCCHI
jgi:hypothetical protein